MNLGKILSEKNESRRVKKNQKLLKESLDLINKHKKEEEKIFNQEANGPKS